MPQPTVRTAAGIKRQLIITVAFLVRIIYIKYKTHKQNGGLDYGKFKRNPD